MTTSEITKCESIKQLESYRNELIADIEIDNTEEIVLPGILNSKLEKLNRRLYYLKHDKPIFDSMKGTHDES